MRFRRLTIEELTELETEFKQFLIINQVYNEEWIEMNQKDLKKANALVDLFSDQVLEKVYSKMNFLEIRSPKTYSIFSFNEQTINSLIIQSKDESVLLSTEQEIENALNTNLLKLEVFKASKPLTKAKSEEVFELINQGAIISKPEVWHAFSLFFDQKN
jgi:hypothetical protein